MLQFIAGTVFGIIVTVFALIVIIIAAEDRKKGNGW